MTPRATGQLTVDVLLSPDEREAAQIEDARVGLTATPKTLSPLWFYDERGSDLFDAITRLPEYYLTRAERGLLVEHAAEIAKVSGANCLVELGSGTSDKTRVLLDAMAGVGTLERYVGLDVSEETLRAAGAALAGEYPELAIHAVVGDFHRHLGDLPREGRRLVAFIGSTIGNLDPEARRRFLFDLDCALTDSDRLLLGVDLVKAPARLLAAYDDRAGVTAEFNRNALRHLNAALGGDFAPDAFDHVATWNAAEERIEMRLQAQRAMTVRLDRLDLTVTFDAGESLLTEISSKFTAAGIEAELYQAGFITEQTWAAGGDFLLLLARPYC